MASNVYSSPYEQDKLWAFVCDPLHVDLDAYSYWLKGHPVASAAQHYLGNHPSLLEEFDAAASEAHFHDQYRTYHSLEPHMTQPPAFEKHRNYQIHPKIVVELIELFVSSVVMVV